MKSKNIILKITILIVLFASMHSAQKLQKVKDRNYKLVRLSELKVVEPRILQILDTLIYNYQDCPDYDELHPWEIYIESKDGSETKKIVGINISQSFYENAPKKGYGYFWYKNLFFMVNGVKMKSFFKITKKSSKMLIAKIIPITIYDPPRAYYFYDNNKFYLWYSVPCGG